MLTPPDIFTFADFPCRLWNALPYIDLNLPLPTIKNKLYNFYGNILLVILIVTLCVLFIMSGPVPNVL